MENQNNIPQPTGLDLFEAGQNDWIAVIELPNGKKIDVQYIIDDCAYTMSNDRDTCGWSLSDISHMQRGDELITWPEYYRLHCLSRPFKPEEWGWEQLRPEVYRNEKRWDLNSLGEGLWYISRTSYDMYFSIPTAREYLSLAGMLGIETKTESA